MDILINHEEIKNKVLEGLSPDEINSYNVIYEYSKLLLDHFDVYNDEIMMYISLYGNKLDVKSLLGLDDHISHYSYIINSDYMDNNMSRMILNNDNARISKIILRISQLYESYYSESYDRFTELANSYSKFTSKFTTAVKDFKFTKYSNDLRKYCRTMMDNPDKVTDHLANKIIVY